MAAEAWGERIRDALSSACHPRDLAGASVSPMAMVGLLAPLRMSNILPLRAPAEMGALDNPGAVTDINALVVTLFAPEGRSSNSPTVSSLEESDRIDPKPRRSCDDLVVGRDAPSVASACGVGAHRVGTTWLCRVLTWEPRRVRLHLTRTATCAILAFVIAICLQVVFLTALLLAVFGNGTTARVDGPWWLALAWFAVLENLIRGLRPGWKSYLWGENLGAVVQWSSTGGEFRRAP